MPAKLYPVLYEVAKAVNSTLVVQDILQTIVETTAQALGVKACSLLLLSPNQTELFHAASWGLSAAYVGKGPVTVTPHVRRLLNGRPQFVRDVASPRAAMQYPEAALAEGIQSVYSAPLLLRGNALGILRLYLALPRRVTARQQDFLAAVADVAAVAIENARNHETLRKDYEAARQTLLEWYAARNAERQAARPPAFAHPSEEEFARVLDFYQVRWQYEPRSFPLQWDGDRIMEMFTPDFYLPEQDLYIELTTLRQRLVTHKNGKLRRLRELYPDINARLLYRKDYHRLLAKYGYRPVGSDESATDVGRVLFTPLEIEERVKALGRQISEDYAGRTPVLVGVLKGVVVFMADLVRHISAPLELDFMAISSLGPQAEGSVRIVKDLTCSIEGRDVLVVEDIVDTGMTLNYLLHYLQSLHPASLEVCALLDKRARRLVPVPMKYVAFEVPDEFVVGYGLDYQEQYRHLPFIGVLRGEGDGASVPAAPSKSGAQETGLGEGKD